MPPCVSIKVNVKDRNVGFWKPTIRNTLPIVVGLDLRELGSNPLKVDFVLCAREQNEGSNYTSTSTGPHLGLDLAIEDLVCA